MKYRFVQKALALSLLSALAILMFACEKQNPADSTASGEIAEAYKSLFEAVKSKDPERIKQRMSKNSMNLAQLAAGQQKKSVDEVVMNGFSETTFAETLPRMRGEMVKDDYATIEVWNEKRNTWEVIPFVREDGMWKAAFGDMFAGTFKSPGKSQSLIERENANAANPQVQPISPNLNANTGFTNPAANSNVKPIKPTEKKEK